MSSSESSYSSDERPRNKRRSKQKRKQNKDSTKNLFQCNNCDKRFKFRSQLLRHLPGCEGTGPGREKSNLTCHWCNLSFKNRGNLATHAFHLHGDSSYKNANNTTKKITYNCHICQRSFSQNFQLTYHIRRIHFNLKGKTPYAERKKINQVWFEKVLNSDNIIEIKKTGQNTLVMRKLDETTAIKVNNDNSNVIDLSHMYPTCRGIERVECGICGKMYVKRDIKKHLEEIHYNRKKHYCNNCNRTFKRSYHYLKHVCSRMHKVRGVKQFDSELKITSIESLSVPFM